MMNGRTIGLVLLLMLLKFVVTEVQFTHKMELHEDYHMFWTFDDDYITVKLVVNTTGWIGWGLSSKPLMKGADMVIGWVDSDGNNHFHDRYAEGRRMPSIDCQQDYHLLNGDLEMTEKDSTTTVIFKRKLRTDDDRDVPVNLDTMRVLWSWNDEDPKSDTDIPMHTKKGAKSALLLDYGAIMAQPLPKQYKTFDFRMENYQIPPVKTLYWCKTFKLPNLGSKKQHVIQIDPIITKGNEGIVHHMLVYECTHLEDKYVNYQHQCRFANMGSSRCTTLTLHSWAIGGTAFYYPSMAGFSLNTQNDPKYFVLEIHYDNPEEKQGVIDSSGFRFYHTEKLRDFDSGIIYAGIFPVWDLREPDYFMQIIPQHQDSFTSYGFCSSKCIRSDVATKIFAIMPHAHLQGRKITARLMNETTGKEVQTIIDDSAYDFNFQEIRYLKDPIRLLPGHRIDVECTYETNDRDSPVVNGLGTKEEMCSVFLFHYPKVSLKTCWSNPFYYDDIIGKEFGWSVDRDSRIESSFIVGNKDYMGQFFTAPLVDPKFWTSNKSRVKTMETLGEVIPYYYKCWYEGNVKDRGVFYNQPRILLPKPSQDQKKAECNSGGLNASPKWFAVLVLFAFSIFKITLTI